MVYLLATFELELSPKKLDGIVLEKSDLGPLFTDETLESWILKLLIASPFCWLGLLAVPPPSSNNFVLLGELSRLFCCAYGRSFTLDIVLF